MFIGSRFETFAKRSFSKPALICPISMSPISGIYASTGSNFGTLVKLQRYPQNIQYIYPKGIYYAAPVGDPPEADRLP